MWWTISQQENWVIKILIEAGHKINGCVYLASCSGIELSSWCQQGNWVPPSAARSVRGSDVGNQGFASPGILSQAAFTYWPMWLLAWEVAANELNWLLLTIEIDWQLAFTENKIWGGKNRPKVDRKERTESGEDLSCFQRWMCNRNADTLKAALVQQWSKGVSQVRYLCLCDLWSFRNAILSCFSVGAEYCFKGLNNSKRRYLS